MYKLVLFNEIKAAFDLLSSGVAGPLALIVRLSSGSLVEIDLGLNDEGGKITDAVRNLLPSSSSALILRNRDLHTLDEHLGHWEYVVHSLWGQSGIDQETEGR